MPKVEVTHLGGLVPLLTGTGQTCCYNLVHNTFKHAVFDDDFGGSREDLGGSGDLEREGRIE